MVSKKGNVIIKKQTRLNRVIFSIGTILCMYILALGDVYAAQIDRLRVWSSPNNTRLVFDISAPVSYEILQLSNPDRIVVDIKNTTIAQALPRRAPGHSVILAIRSSVRNKHDYRVVLDVNTKVESQGFLLKPTGHYGHRLVLDLKNHTHPKATVKFSTPTPSKPKLSNSKLSNLELSNPRLSNSNTANKPKQHRKKRDIIVAIDAGHGGEDPGALGRKGTKEKDVVLAIARKLEKLLKKTYGIKPVMIRQGDYYVSLRGRIIHARKLKADLFVSVHADAVRNRKAHGASVFVLSRKAATNEAIRWLEKTQNNTDLLGGVSLDDKDDILASVLLDLAQSATLVASVEVGSSVLDNLKNVGNVHKGLVERAGFVVLKSPDIPSILVETGFISNKREEKKLKNKKYQTKIAQAIHEGINQYFKKYPPPDSLLAAISDYHEIKQGDTLSDIANLYNISEDDLRDANSLNSDNIVIGQIIRIPSRDDG